MKKTTQLILFHCSAFAAVMLCYLKGEFMTGVLTSLFWFGFGVLFSIKRKTVVNIAFKPDMTIKISPDGSLDPSEIQDQVAKELKSALEKSHITSI